MVRTKSFDSYGKFQHVKREPESRLRHHNFTEAVVLSSRKLSFVDRKCVRVCDIMIIYPNEKCHINFWKYVR